MPWEKARCENDRFIENIRALHTSGRITRQEAASMMPVQALEVQPGDRVLDMCAAPGSKTTQIAEALDGSGLVVANEPNPGRANNLVSKCTTFRASECRGRPSDGRNFPRVAEPGFDRILVDAPCTGTGTTRKNTDVWATWETTPWRAHVSLASRNLVPSCIVASTGWDNGLLYLFNRPNGKRTCGGAGLGTLPMAFSEKGESFRIVPRAQYSPGEDRFN